jgi:hypothetical protein
VFCKCPPDAARNCKQTWRSFARELGPAISGAFDADSYRTRIEMIPGGVQETRRRGTAGSGDESVEHGVALLRTPEGFAFAPVVEKKVISPKEFGKLPEEEQKRIEKTIEEYSEKLHPAYASVSTLGGAKCRDESSRQVVKHSAWPWSICSMTFGRPNSDLPEVLTFLDELLADVIETGEALRDGQENRRRRACSGHDCSSALFCESPC